MVLTGRTVHFHPFGPDSKYDLVGQDITDVGQRMTGVGQNMTRICPDLTWVGKI